MTSADRVLVELDAIRDWQELIYLDLHRHPELSSHEERTVGVTAHHLDGFGYDVHHIGGGVVGVLANGDGPRVLLRADMDALPVTEQTGLPYASTVTAQDGDGNAVGVMHACGHDIHVAALLGAARLMAERQNAWNGSLIVVFQPAEETAAGAQAMIDAGLLDAIPRPDVALAQHVLGIETGTIAVVAGPSLACADSIRIMIHGQGSHGAMPNLGVDPVIVAAAVIQRLQSIVSRELPPGERAVVTVGAVHAGSKSNVISDHAELLVNTRAYSSDIRDQIVAAIERIVRAECAASACPREPEFEYYDQFPLTDNDPATTQRVANAMRLRLGDTRVGALTPLAASEDFSRIPEAFGIPYTYWGLGGFPSGVVAPPNHSPLFAPQMQPTLRTGTEALVTAALAYLGENSEATR
ncbi:MULTISPECIES: amidohydrolase [unclassified Microbacterium]|uniref:amidohydrolase n=1 Tax=unclassified Microbacterium TaxID=2609290 RepID=UPI0004933D14|nr:MULTISPECIES: amidohydrolase [unclassified Microbacterium]